MQNNQMTQNGLARKYALAGLRAQYDSEAKYILCERTVLAFVIPAVVEEMRGLKPWEILAYIDGTPEVAKVAVRPGETNIFSEIAITGDNTESNIPGEGSYTFDVKFRLALPEGSRDCRVIINLEAQKDLPSGYDITERGIFYTSRMISSQYGTEFTGEDYSKIKKVYSIWIVMNCTDGWKDTMTRYYMERQDITGKLLQKERYNLTEVVVIRLGEELAPPGVDELRLHRFLGIIYSKTLSAKSKRKLLQREFKLYYDKDLERRTSKMCNLSDAIVKDAMRKGERRGEKRGERRGEKRGEKRGRKIGIYLGEQKKLRSLVKCKIEKGKTIEQIAEDLEESVESISVIYNELVSC